MKCALALILAAGCLSAQAAGGRAAGGVVFANPGGFGNVAFPGTGRPQVSSLNSVGIAGQPLRSGQVRNGLRNGSRGSGIAYGYPVFVGNGYDSFGTGFVDGPAGYNQPLPNITILNNPPAQTAPAVVINQIYGAPMAGDPGSEQTTHIFQPAPRPEFAPSSDTSATAAPHYFLIAYKDHSVYSALTYWVEDKTLHYVTPQQTHNQASLDLIDMSLTKQLNQR